MYLLRVVGGEEATLQGLSIFTTSLQTIIICSEVGAGGRRGVRRGVVVRLLFQEWCKWQLE